MHIAHLKLTNFKNYSDVKLNFCHKFNCFTGCNGAGKTNVLDALHYLSLTKSYFNNNDKLHIKKSKDFFRIEGKLFNEKENIENLTCVFTTEKGKTFKRNDKLYSRYSEHIGRLPSVVISPNDSRLVTGTSDERRKYIDSVISQYDRDYLYQLIKYKKVLKQRNTLLKAQGNGLLPTDDTLEVYNIQLNEAATIIHKKRTEFINELRPVFEKYYNFISDHCETIQIQYTSSLNKESLYNLLHNSFEKDCRLQYTYYGIHRDDIELFVNDFKISKSGSQGQQKTFLTSLKLAQHDFINRVSGKNPVLLLDDIFDKFDAKRVRQIIQLIKDEKFGQIFITDTNTERINSILEDTKTIYKLFEIEDNVIKEITKL